MKMKLLIDEDDLKMLARLSKTPWLYEALLKILLLNDFKEFVQKTRTAFHIPGKGYGKNEVFIMDARIYSFKSRKELRVGKNDVVKIFKKVRSYVVEHRGLHPGRYKDSHFLGSLVTIIFEYTFYGEVSSKGAFNAHISLVPNGMFQDVVRLEFSVNSTQKEMAAYLKEHWFLVNEWQRIKDPSRPLQTRERHKPRMNLDRDIKIYNLYVDLENKIIPRKKVYPEMDVRNLMQERYNLKVFDVAARKAFERMKEEISALNPDT
jgi:hypothetical protein